MDRVYRGRSIEDEETVVYGDSIEIVDENGVEFVQLRYVNEFDEDVVGYIVEESLATNLGYVCFEGKPVYTDSELVIEFGSGTRYKGFVDYREELMGHVLVTENGCFYIDPESLENSDAVVFVIE